jgi:hypothetical protein
VNVVAAKKRAYDNSTTSRYPQRYEYDGNAARKLERKEEDPRRSEVRRRVKKSKAKPQLAVREPGKVAPFAVLGLLTVCLMVVLMLHQYANLMMINDTAVKWRQELVALQTEGDKLVAQYELAYDLQAIEEEFLATGLMVKPQQGQEDVLELTAPDAVEYYKTAGFGSKLLSGVGEIFSTIGAYF